MTNNAVSKAVIQVALVIALVLTANAIRPFSLGNVALHTLATARSFSFVLPDAAVKRIEHANYLAQAYGKSLLDGDRNNSIWANETTLRSGLVASTDSADSSDEAEIKDVNPGEPARKSAPKRSSRRIKRDGRDEHDEVSASSANSQGGALLPVLPSVAPASDSVAMAQPMPLPVYKLASAKTQVIPASMKLPLPSKLNSCNTIEVRSVKLIALIQQSPKVKVNLLTPQPATISLQCREEEKVETEEVKSSAETTVGPEEEFFFDQAHTAPFSAAPTPECTKFP